MIDYPDWTDDALVAEVASRMPQDQYRVKNGEAQKLYPFYDEDEQRDPAGDVWGLWFPHLDCLCLEDVKHEIERQGWLWSAGWTVGGYVIWVDTEGINNPFEQYICSSDLQRTETRAWLIAYLRATDEQRD
jgi:hypothetical protein